MQLSILTSILQSRIRYAAQSRVLSQVQQQQQINSVRYNNNTATSSLGVLCSRRGIVDYDVIYSSTYRRGLIGTSRARVVPMFLLGHFDRWALKFFNFYDKSKTAKCGILKFGHNITSLQSIMHTNFGGRRSRDNDLGTLKPTKNGYFWAEIFLFRL